jgi:tetratricopeptide (TPR) repeat protein
MTRILLAGLAAVLVLGAAAQAQPQRLQPFSTARLYLTEADFNRAIQPYQQAIQADARNATAQYWLGFAYLYAYRQYTVGAAPYAGGYLDKAIPPLEEAIKLSPTTVDAYAALHDVYQLKGDLAKADEITALMLQRTRPGWLPAVPAPEK